MNSLPEEIEAIISHIDDQLLQIRSRTRFLAEKIDGFGHAYFHGQKIWKIHGKSYSYRGYYIITTKGVTFMLNNLGAASNNSRHIIIDFMEPNLLPQISILIQKLLS